MLKSTLVIAGLCVSLCACKPKPAGATACDAGDCAHDAGACSGADACVEAEDAAVVEGESRVGGGGSGSRVQAVGRGEAGAGGSAAVGAADASRAGAGGARAGGADAGRSGASARGGAEKSRAKSGAAGQGGGDSGGAGAPMKLPVGGAAGDDCRDEACKAARLASCDAGCKACEACSADDLSCRPVTGRDDADSCSEQRSCSSAGACLRVSEAQPELGPSIDYVELTATYAQVIDFAASGHVVEMRLEVSCNENDAAFPPVWISQVENGVPSDAVFAFANVLYQEPTQSHAFALLELSKQFDEPDTGPIAIVVGKSDMSCIVRINRDHPYERGSLLTQRESGLWVSAEGSMVFQVLSK